MASPDSASFDGEGQIGGNEGGKNDDCSDDLPHSKGLVKDYPSAQGCNQRAEESKERCCGGGQEMDPAKPECVGQCSSDDAEV